MLLTCILLCKVGLLVLSVQKTVWSRSKVVTSLPVLRTVQKIVLIPQVRSLDVDVCMPVVVQRQAPWSSRAGDRGDTTGPLWDLVADMLVVMQRLTPVVQTVHFPVEFSQLQFFDKVFTSLSWRRGRPTGPRLSRRPRCFHRCSTLTCRRCHLAHFCLATETGTLCRSFD